MGKRRDAKRAALNRLARRETGYRQTPLEDRLSNPMPGDVMDRREVIAWSWARRATIEGDKVTFSLGDRPGHRTVKGKAPKWYRTVRTDTTDKLDRNNKSYKDAKNW